MAPCFDLFQIETNGHLTLCPIMNRVRRKSPSVATFTGSSFALRRRTFLTVGTAEADRQAPPSMTSSLGREAIGSAASKIRNWFLMFGRIALNAAAKSPGAHSLLSIGACVMDDENETFSCELKPVNRNAVPAAMKVTGMSLDILARTGLETEEAMRRFASWATGLAQDGSLVS